MADDVVAKVATDSAAAASFPADMSLKEFIELVTPIYMNDEDVAKADLVGALACMVMRLGSPAANVLRGYVKWWQSAPIDSEVNNAHRA